MTIQATVQNTGQQAAADVLVAAYEGGALIGSGTIVSIAGKSQAAVSFSYDTTGMSGLPKMYPANADR